MAYASSDADLVALESDAAIVTSALEATAFEIDAAFATAGYGVPLDPTEISDADSETRFDEFLKWINKALAAGTLSRRPSAKRGVPDNIQANYDRAIALLAQIQAGQMDAHLTELTKRAATEAFKVIGAEKWPDFETLFKVQQAVSF